MNKALTQYLRQVRTFLPCGRKAKKTILGKIESSVSACLENDPAMDYAQIQARFGTPQQIALSYVDEMNSAELLRSMRIRKKIITAITAGIVAALLIFTAFLAGTVIMAHNSLNGYAVIEIGGGQ